MSKLINSVAEFLKEQGLQDKTLVVGFSGGFDSMCLLDILSKLKQEQRDFFEMRLIAAHFNHNWRGEESLKEQEVCRIFAASRSAEFFTKTAPPELKKTENDARIARYEFFEETVENYDADAVLTAHNKDDNAETILYRIIKGTGLVGLKGVMLKRDNIYRPFLKTMRSEILEYCEKYNLAPNNDSSNSDTTYKRNFLRLNVFPMLEQLNPMVKDAFNTLSEVAINEDLIIEEYFSTLRERVYNEDKILSREYKNLSKPVKMRFIHEYIQKFDIDYDYKRIREIYDFIESNLTRKNGSTLSLATALWLYADDKVIETIPPRHKMSTLGFCEVCVKEDGEYICGDKKFILRSFRLGTDFKFPNSTANIAYVDLSNVDMPLQLRGRKDGDLINPLGMSGSMKLKKFFNSKGVNRHKRDEILLLTSNNEVLWAVGVGLSDKIGVKHYPTHILEVI